MVWSWLWCGVWSWLWMIWSWFWVIWFIVGYSFVRNFSNVSMFMISSVAYNLSSTSGRRTLYSPVTVPY